MELSSFFRPLFFAALLVLGSFPSSPLLAEAPDDSAPTRATVQQRVAPKTGRYHVHATGARLIRDDFYDTWGFGLDLGYHFSEEWGIELRAQKLQSSLSAAADDLRETHGLIPDLRAPSAILLAGPRLSWGYGKVLSFNRFVVYFDPQITLKGGVLFAEDRLIPSFATALGFLGHFGHGFQIKLDLQFSVHIEQRSRGTLPSFGFAPILAIGWSPQGGH